MTIGIVVEDAGYSQMDFRNPDRGNPGVSGTVYEFLMLIKYAPIKSDHNFVVLHFGDNKYGIESYCIENHSDISIISEKKIDLLIVQNGLEVSFYEKLNTLFIPTIVWAHNYLTGEAVELLSRLDNVVRVVFVGREQYDHYVGHDIINKSTYIYNMVESNDDFRNTTLQPVVTYTGSIVPNKAFHMVANVWSDVLKKIPNAELYVIGSGKLYDRRNSLGKYSIAEKKYESEFIDKITENGRIIPSVHFCGIVGDEKKDIYQKTKVGIMNPSGISETFGISGVEMEAMGIPVITAKRYGCLDTVINYKTGILVKSEKQLKEAIIKLLMDDELNRQFGSNAKDYVKQNFSPIVIIKEWLNLFDEIEQVNPVKFIHPKSNYFNDYKWIFICNHYIRRVLPFFPSIIGFNTRNLKKEQGDNKLRIINRLLLKMLGK